MIKLLVILGTISKFAQNIETMRYTLLLLILTTMVGCKSSDSPEKEPVIKQSVIEGTCKDAEEDVLTPEQIVWFDSANANGGYVLVRNAERYCDTVVNHLHIIFTTDK